MDSAHDQHRTLGFLRDQGLAYVNLDMPQGFKSSLPATAEVTDPKLAMVRSHGRDPEAWVKKTVHERFRYRYKPEELQEWVPLASSALPPTPNALTFFGRRLTNSSRPPQRRPDPWHSSVPGRMRA